VKAFLPILAIGVAIYLFLTKTSKGQAIAAQAGIPGITPSASGPSGAGGSSSSPGGGSSLSLNPGSSFSLGGLGQALSSLLKGDYSSGGGGASNPSTLTSPMGGGTPYDGSYSPEIPFEGGTPTDSALWGAGQDYSGVYSAGGDAVQSQDFMPAGGGGSDAGWNPPSPDTSVYQQSWDNQQPQPDIPFESTYSS
jgi:hypothetical protein